MIIAERLLMIGTYIKTHVVTILVLTKREIGHCLYYEHGWIKVLKIEKLYYRNDFNFREFMNKNKIRWVIL